MKKVEILIVVDASGALSSSNLQDNVYLVDTNKYVGSGNEGQAELKTACKDEQLISWRVESISPDNEVSIKGFIGQMIDQKICVPTKQGIGSDVYWEGRIESRGTSQIVQYSAILVLDGKEMNFDPFLVIS